MAKEIAEEYASSLADLTVNSKPLINMLTILAEENVDHAGVIVDTVEKHLEKVQADIKLPILYLVDSIIKNVGGAYTQKFAQSIVNMFTRTFKQVDEKVRAQMFKLRETWHDVFPATKLYQLDVKVNLIDPAWPIQAQPQQSNIHVNPNFLKKPMATTSGVAPLTEDEEKMRSILAKKEQELLMLQKKKIEMELEQTKRQLELAEKNAKKIPIAAHAPGPMPPSMVALVNPVVPVVPAAPDVPVSMPVPVKQRLGPPVNKSMSGARITPVSGALAAARRDPRLARRLNTATVAPDHLPPIAPNVFDIKPLDRVTKRKNVITIDVNPEVADSRIHRDPRLKRDLDRPRRDRNRVREERRKAEERSERERNERKLETKNERQEKEEKAANDFIDKLQIPDTKKINKLPPIPKLNREEREIESPIKRKKEIRPKKKRDPPSKDSSSGSSPEKKSKEIKVKEAKEAKETRKLKLKETKMEVDVEKPAEPEVVAFKELKNYHKERYRRNKETDTPDSPEPQESEDLPTIEKESPNVPEVVVENKDVDLRVLHPVVTEVKAAPIAQKRPSTETVEGKAKKNKLDKFDILFGNEDVDLRQLPQVEEHNPPPAITDSLKSEPKSDEAKTEEFDKISPIGSPKKDWHEVKEKNVKKTPSKLDLVRAKLAEATKGKDRLGRPLLFSKSPSIERERRNTLNSEDMDLRVNNGDDFDTENNKKTISIIMSQAKEEFKDGKLDKMEYNKLMYQVLQLNEKLKLKEAKQKESLEISKRKLKNIEEKNVPNPKSSPNNTFGDIDERVMPFMDTPPDSQNFGQDLDMRFNNIGHDSIDDSKAKSLLPLPPAPAAPMFGGRYPMWRGQPRNFEEFGPRRMRGPTQPFFRGRFEKRGPRPFERLPLPLPTPKIGMCQGACPLPPYERVSTPPPLGAPGVNIPPTNFKVLEYIDQDPVKSIQIDGISREIIFYGETAVIMYDWDDPREISFLPGCRRVSFDNKDSIVLSFNEGYKQVDIEDQVFDIRFGAPTRELYINGRWFECVFGGQPLGVIIDGKPRLIHLEGPIPQVNIGKEKRIDLVAGKINLIVDATHMCPVFLDAKVQKFSINGRFYTIRFVDAFRTVLINEQPFTVEFGGLPKPIFFGNRKHFIRFSVLPRHVKPGYSQIANMEGAVLPLIPPPTIPIDKIVSNVMDVDEEPLERPNKTPSPDGENQGLDMLASLMPSTMAPASNSEYSMAEPLFAKHENIPGFENDDQPTQANPTLPILGNINVNDLFAKLVATGIVQVPSEKKEEEAKEDRSKVKEDKTTIHRVDLLKPETLRVKQPGLVAKLYGGMQCSGCGARFPPEHTVRYSQHLDWHFRQNRRERESARRPHSRHWHYDLSDWLNYEEIEELEDREKSWFESGGVEGESEALEPLAEAPSVPAGAPAQQHCALCGDLFHQFYNEDKDEWHLRNSVRYEDKNYHPLCFEDYKASLTKEEAPKEEAIIITEGDKIEEAIEIKDVDDETNDQSDNESVVEVVEPEPVKAPQETLEIDEEEEVEDEGEEDDVVLKAEPVEQVVVEDDADTDDETQATRAERDRLAHIDFTNVKVKQEPIDPDDEPVITAEEEAIHTSADTTQTTVLSSIDGNLQLDATPATVPLPSIRINITKSIPSFVNNNQEDKMLEDISVDDEPLPPGEEPELTYKLKESLEGIQFSRQPPVQRGSELSGLCSIM